MDTYPFEHSVMAGLASQLALFALVAAGFMMMFGARALSVRLLALGVFLAVAASLGAGQGQ
jgi:type IV secretory pathway VirB2 component (pilin)